MSRSNAEKDNNGNEDNRIIVAETNSDSADTNPYIQPSNYPNLINENIILSGNSDIERPLLQNTQNLDSINNNNNNLNNNIIANDVNPVLNVNNNAENLIDEFEYERIQGQNFRISPKKYCNSNSNPISQYNYFISICNLSICKEKAQKYRSIPFCNCFASFYDIYIILIKKLASVSTCLCGLCCKCFSNIPMEQDMVETHLSSGHRRYYTESFVNFNRSAFHLNILSYDCADNSFQK